MRRRTYTSTSRQTKFAKVTRFLGDVREAWGAQFNAFLERQEWARAVAAGAKQERRLSRPHLPRPFAVRFLFLVVLGVLTVAGTYVAIMWVLTVPSPILPPEFQSIDESVRNDAIRTALTATAGVGALAAILISYRRQRNDEATHLSERDKAFTDRFTAAAAQLGHDRAAVRLAGVYALARIAKDSIRDRSAALETLAGYLRLSKGDDAAEQEVRRTALAQIANHLRVREPNLYWSTYELDLSRADLGGLELGFINVSGDVVFKDSIFHDAFTMRGCESRGRIDFSRAVFHKDLTLIGISAHPFIDFTDATLNHAHITTSGATFLDLSRATLDGRMELGKMDDDRFVVFVHGTDLSSQEFRRIRHHNDGQARQDSFVWAEKVEIWFDDETKWPAEFSGDPEEGVNYYFSSGEGSGWRVERPFVVSQGRKKVPGAAI